MFLQRRKVKSSAIFELIVLTVLLVAALPLASAQESNDAKPVLPADTTNNSGKNVAKATALPATDIPSSRVSGILPDSYVIGIDDVLLVSVWKESELSRTVAVRPDGMITLPLVGEIKAVGLTPNQLQDQVVASLQKIMSDPQVTIIVSTVNSMSYNVMGQVGKPGYYPLTRPLTVLDAIALCGGFRDFAKQKKIYVLRTTPDGKEVRLKFNYKEVIKGKNMAQNIPLQAHDTVVVP